MLIKSADDKQPSIDALEALLTRPDVDTAIKSKIDRELKNIRAGAKGERDAAYEIDFDYANEPQRVVIHDLRLEVDGRVAQIDHLIIDRLLSVWVCESKHFAEGVGVNEHGEWVAFYGNRPQGIASPIEQNRRHIAVLQDLFDQKLVEPKKRLGLTIKPQLKSVILVSNNARISRPKGKAAAKQVDGLETVMKLEKLQSMIKRDIERAPTLSVLKRVVGTDTIERLGRDLAALHQPITVDWAARFGLGAEQVASVAAPPRQSSARNARVCERCGAAISYGVARYSETHAEQFGGRILCMSCQKTAVI
jgi:Nuclease-related domain.